MVTASSCPKPAAFYSSTLVGVEEGASHLKGPYVACLEPQPGRVWRSP